MVIVLLWYHSENNGYIFMIYVSWYSFLVNVYLQTDSYVNSSANKVTHPKPDGSHNFRWLKNCPWTEYKQA